MKTYEEALYAAAEIYSGHKFSSARDTFFYSSMYLLAEVYEKPAEHVSTDLSSTINAAMDAKEKARKAEWKKRYQDENEQRRLANIAKKASNGP